MKKGGSRRPFPACLPALAEERDVLLGLGDPRGVRGPLGLGAALLRLGRGGEFRLGGLAGLRAAGLRKRAVLACVARPDPRVAVAVLAVRRRDELAAGEAERAQHLAARRTGELLAEPGAHLVARRARRLGVRDGLGNLALL